MAYFFTSDLHFGSRITLKRENRPFKNVDDFNEYVVKVWNSQANKTDFIYVLGDFFSYSYVDRISYKSAINLVKKINAKIILILGNNEGRIIKEEFDGNFDKFRNFLINQGFFDVKYDMFLEINNRHFYLNHYPRNHKDGYINLFGHIHKATGLYKPFGFNMSCDLNYFRLYSVEDIEDLIIAKEKHWLNDPDVNS